MELHPDFHSTRRFADDVNVATGRMVPSKVQWFQIFVFNFIIIKIVLKIF